VAARRGYVDRSADMVLALYFGEAAFVPGFVNFPELGGSSKKHLKQVCDARRGRAIFRPLPNVEPLT